MQFIDNAPLYRIVRITGPQHNMLGVQLSTLPLGVEPEIEILNVDSREMGSLSREDVLEQVMLGVAQASLECNQKYFVEKIQYLTTDSLPVTVYHYLAAEIVRRVCASKK